MLAPKFRVFLAVSINLCVNNGGTWINDASDFKTPLFELHDRRIVDARSLGKNQDGKLVRIFHVILQSESLAQQNKNVTSKVITSGIRLA